MLQQFNVSAEKIRDKGVLVLNKGQSDWTIRPKVVQIIEQTNLIVSQDYDMKDKNWSVKTNINLEFLCPGVPTCYNPAVSITVGLKGNDNCEEYL